MSAVKTITVRTVYNKVGEEGMKRRRELLEGVEGESRTQPYMLEEETKGWREGIKEEGEGGGEG